MGLGDRNLMHKVLNLLIDFSIVSFFYEGKKIPVKGYR